MANEKRLIKMCDATAVYNGIVLYMAENAYLNDTALDVLKMVANWLNEAPTVDAVEVVHGHWINNGGHRKMDLYCSVCNRRASNFVGGYEDWWDLWFPKYCPNCGAKMDGDGNG